MTKNLLLLKNAKIPKVPSSDPFPSPDTRMHDYLVEYRRVGISRSLQTSKPNEAVDVEFPLFEKAKRAARAESFTSPPPPPPPPTASPSVADVYTLTSRWSRLLEWCTAVLLYCCTAVPLFPSGPIPSPTPTNAIILPPPRPSSDNDRLDCMASENTRRQAGAGRFCFWKMFIRQSTKN